MTKAVTTNCQLDPAAGTWADVLTLPELPTAEQRRELEKHSAQLNQLLEQKPIAAEKYAKQTFGLIAKLILAKPARSGSPEATEARAEAYEIALEDVPSWAVSIATRKWHRGECGCWNRRDQYDYRWAPESADLRQIALREAYALHGRIADIDKVLQAVPYRDSADERGKNEAAINQIMTDCGFRQSATA
jgi:hypothetical protein